MTGQEGEGRRAGRGVPWTDTDRARTRWVPVLIVAGATLWLTVVLVGVAEQTVAGAAWVRVSVVVVAVAVFATFAVLAVLSPPPAGVPRPAEIRGGYGIDDPEQRRVRRALRDGTPLRLGDRDRALAQARRSLFRTVPGAMGARDRYVNVALLGYLLATGLLNSSSLIAPSFGSSDLKTLAALGVTGVVLAVIGWLPGRLGLPGRRWREGRLRRRVEELESHPVAP